MSRRRPPAASSDDDDDDDDDDDSDDDDDDDDDESPTPAARGGNDDAAESADEEEGEDEDDASQPGAAEQASAAAAPEPEEADVSHELVALALEALDGDDVSPVVRLAFERSAPKVRMLHPDCYVSARLTRPVVPDNLTRRLGAGCDARARGYY